MQNYPFSCDTSGLLPEPEVEGLNSLSLAYLIFPLAAIALLFATVNPFLLEQLPDGIPALWCYQTEPHQVPAINFLLRLLVKVPFHALLQLVPADEPVDRAEKKTILIKTAKPITIQTTH